MYLPTTLISDFNQRSNRSIFMVTKRPRERKLKRKGKREKREKSKIRIKERRKEFEK